RSMGAVGTSADNAACESFHASLKRETLQGAHHYGDASTCRRTVFAWLTRYNTRRRHSANGHLSPNEYEHRHHTPKLTLAASSITACPPSRGKAPSGFDSIMPKTLATAAVDRLLHHAHIVLTEGSSLRLTQATSGDGVVPLNSGA
ncbi:integrase core domain-containing protein, partial [Streptomyces sp. NPDC002778]